MSYQRGTQWGLDSDHAEDWRAKARCRDEDPDAFFPVGKGAIAKAQAETAKRICRRCPALPQCRAWTLAHKPEFGVFAAMTEDERRRICQWCDQVFAYDSSHPQARICTSCAERERFGPKPRLTPVGGNGSKTHCPAGHLYDLSNTYRDSGGHRHCRRCRNESKARAKARSMT